MAEAANAAGAGGAGALAAAAKPTVARTSPTVLVLPDERPNRVVDQHPVWGMRRQRAQAM